MRNHIVKPKGWLRKDRDYVMFEKGPFLYNLSLVLDLLKKCMYMPPDLSVLISAVSKSLEMHKLEDLRQCTEQARQLAWKYNRTAHDDKAALFLMLFDALDGFYVAESKQPDEFTAKKRTG